MTGVPDVPETPKLPEVGPSMALEAVTIEVSTVTFGVQLLANNLYRENVLDGLEAQPKNGKCKYEVSRKSFVLGAKADSIICRSILVGHAITAHDTRRSVSCRSQAGARPARPAKGGGCNATLEASL